MTRAGELASRIALPGDPDLDCHLIGLKLASVITADTNDHDAEAVLAFDTSEAAGWWQDSATGECFYPDRVTELTVVFGMSMSPGFAWLAPTLMLGRLKAWADDGALIAMTSAPGKWTMLHSPRHPAGAQVVIPRSPGPATRTREDGNG